MFSRRSALTVYFGWKRGKESDCLLQGKISFMLQKMPHNGCYVSAAIDGMILIACCVKNVTTKMKSHCGIL
jgi:hypothetical protein